MDTDAAVAYFTQSASDAPASSEQLANFVLVVMCVVLVLIWSYWKDRP